MEITQPTNWIVGEESSSWDTAGSAVSVFCLWCKGDHTCLRHWAFAMRCDFLLHISLQVLTFVKLAKKRWFWKLENKLIGGPCTLLYNPCWHFLVKLLTAVFAPVSLMIWYWNTPYPIFTFCSGHTCVIQARHHTTGAANGGFLYRKQTLKTWLRAELGMEPSSCRMYHSLLGLRYKMIMN